MKTCLLVVTHNRLEYTKKCLDHVFRDQYSDFDLCIWDNASVDETPDYLMSLRDPRLVKVYLSKENVGQTVAMNRTWQESKAELVSKLDNDCLVPPGWIKTLMQAHKDIRDLGAVACWHFRVEDFDKSVAARKIISVNGHKIFQHPWVGGTGFVMKRQTFEEIGPWEEGSPNIGTTTLYMKMARAGYINGWYFPLIVQEHMDDPLSPHCISHDDETIKLNKDITYSLRVRNINTLEKLLKLRKRVLENLLYGSPRIVNYIGWRGKLRRVFPIDKWMVRLKLKFPTF